MYTNLFKMIQKKKYKKKENFQEQPILRSDRYIGAQIFHNS